jgi:hypothetical protein
MPSALSSGTNVSQTKDRERFVKVAREVAARRNNKKRRLGDAFSSELISVCLILHEIAQKYVPRTPQAFRDFDALTRATSALRRLQLAPNVSADLCAHTNTADKSMIINSPEYRCLRNKFIAALSTIADMTDKNNPPGSPEYQSGVREGYRRASDIAILFLNDVQTGTTI